MNTKQCSWFVVKYYGAQSSHGGSMVAPATLSTLTIFIMALIVIRTLTLLRRKRTLYTAGPKDIASEEAFAGVDDRHTAQVLPASP